MKRLTNRVMERTDATPKSWFLCMAVIFLCLNYAIDLTLAGLKSPLVTVTGFFYNMIPAQTVMRNT